VDPNETLKCIDKFLLEKHVGSEVDDWAESLFLWIERGGFQPNWDLYPLGTSYYKCHIVQRRKV
jgi:hypothetical protein